MDGADPRAAAQEAVRALRGRIERLDGDALDLILRGARSHYAWTGRDVPGALLREAVEIAMMGPTSMNTLPARFAVVRSQEAKDRLAGALKPANVAKMRGAPATVIVAWDPAFWERLDETFPHDDRKPLFRGKEAFAHATAFRNSTLQGAYLMIAARALGLDVGAMSGFDNAAVDAAFFAASGWRSNFLVNVGYADESAVFPRLPRLSFDDVCEVI